MATFGKLTDGASSSGSSANRVWVSPATPSSTGPVTTGHARLWFAAGHAAGTVNTRFAIYADSSGLPGALLAVSDVLALNRVTQTTEAERVYTFSDVNIITVTSGTQYWIGPAWEDPDTSGTLQVLVSRDNTTTTPAQRQDAATTAGPTLPDPFGTPVGTGTGPIDAYITYTDAPIEKAGTDTALGTETGTSTATSTPPADTALGTESGHVALIAGELAIGTESGYVSESRTGGEDALGTETYDSSATVTPAADTAAGTETYDSLATIDPPVDLAIGAEEGHIAIPGEDTAEGFDAHVPPTLVTVTTGEEALGQEGGYVETLFGDLIVNLYAVDPDTDGLIALPDYIDLDFSRERNSKGSLSLSYPVEGKNFDLLRQSVTDSRDLEYELWTNGTPVGALRGYLQEAAGDDVTEDGSWSFAGGFLETRTDEVLIYPQDRGEQVVDPDTGELEWTNPAREYVVNADTPGAVMITLLEQAQDRDALTDVVWDFTPSLDSSGVAWPGLLSAKFSPGANYTSVLNKLVELHLAEWALVWDSDAQQRVLKLWRAEGRGADLTLGPRPVTLRRGRNLLDAPRKWSVRDSATTVLAAGAEGIYDDATDATALARRGRRVEAYTSLGNAADEEAVLAWAQAQLATLAPGFQSIEHGIGMLPGEPRPVIAFDIGDWIFSQSGIETERLRVVQWTLSIDDQRNLAGTVTLNDTIRDAVERLQERLNAISTGEAIAGTSEPGAQTEDRTPPAAPEGVVASSIAYQDENQGLGQTLAFVTVGWNPVTTNADGADNPLVQAAVYIQNKIEEEAANPEVPDPEQEDGGPDYDPIDMSTWTWKNCPQLVQDFAAPLRALWVEDSSPDTLTWLAAYIAELTATPTAADDVEGYDVRYAYIGLGQVGGIPSSDPFPEEDRFYYLATPPDGTAGNSYSFGGVEGGANLRIEVRAFDRTGNYGAWTSIGHDASNDATPPPVPSAPTGAVGTRFGTIDIPWDGLGAEGEPMPFDFFAVRVWIGQGADMTLPTTEPQYGTLFDPDETGPQFVGTLSASGTWNVAQVPIGVGWYVCLQSVDYVGNPSARSAVIGPLFTTQLVGQDLIDDIIDATKLGPNSVENQHVVNGAITTAKIGTAQIINALIADATIQAAKIGTVSAGSITTGTMSATVTVTGSLWTSLDTNATRLGFSAAGLQLYKTNSPSGGSTLVGEWKTSDGSMLVTGTFRSGTAGQRIHIDTDGTISMFPTSGTNKSTITNESGEMVWRGPLTSSKSGRLNVNTLGVGLNYSQEGNLLGSITSEFVVLDKRARLQAPLVQIIADGDYDTHDGSDHRVQFSATDSSGNTLSNSFVSYMPSQGSNSNRGSLVGQTVGLIFMGGGGEAARLELRHATSSWGSWLNFHANSIVEESSRSVKRDIEDIRALLDPKETIRNARARKFVRETAPTEEPRVGVIAEELPEVLVNRDAGTPGIDHGKMIGVLWGFCNQIIDQEARSVVGRGMVPNGNYSNGSTVTIAVSWDEAPLEAPSDVVAVAMVGMPTGMGKVRARVVPGSVSLTGCQVRVSFTGTVVASNALPIAIEVTGRYIWIPPYVPPEE